MAELEFPSEGELVVCTVSDVKQNGAYTKLDTYNNLEGFIFISLVKSPVVGSRIFVASYVMVSA